MRRRPYFIVVAESPYWSLLWDTSRLDALSHLFMFQIKPLKEKRVIRREIANMEIYLSGLVSHMVLMVPRSIWVVVKVVCLSTIGFIMVDTK